jgi:putative ABC transport system substrate-binding protein
MRRREVIALLGGVAAGWPVSGRSQQPTSPTIGFLNSQTPRDWAYLVAAVRDGLRETGFVEGENLTIEYRWAERNYDRLPLLAEDLIKRQVAVIVATGATAQVAKAATSTVPIVFTSGDDPIKAGLVKSLNHPGGNATGIALFNVGLAAKRFEFFREAMPTASRIAVLLNPNTPFSVNEAEEVREAALTAGLGEVHLLRAASEEELDQAFLSAAATKVDALQVCADPFFNSRRDRLVALAASYKIPTMHYRREFVAAGGLMSYSDSVTDAYRQVGVYTGKVLKGENPANLPVLQPTKFELVVNLKTAKALGLTIPISILARADEVIE